MQEFIYYNKNGLDFPLSEKIQVTTNLDDIKDKSLSELQALLKEKKVLLFELKAKLKTMQLTNTSELRVAKKDIAKIQTAITAVKAN